MLQKILSGEANCANLIQCIYNVNEFELKVYRILTEMNGAKTEELAEKVGRNKSTVYRALQKLISCGLVYRETKTIDRGGYFYIYRAFPSEKVKQDMNQCAQDMYRNIKESLERADTLF